MNKVFKKMTLVLVLIFSIVLTSCNKQLIDWNYNYKKVHLYETGTCYEIESWKDYDGEQLQVHIKDSGKILMSSVSGFLVADKCPICDHAN